MKETNRVTYTYFPVGLGLLCGCASFLVFMHVAICVEEYRSSIGDKAYIYITTA